MIDLAQLYDLGTNANIDIFEGLTLPEDSPLDLETLKNTIMERCGLNIPMYANPKVMQSAVTVWSAKNQYTFKHIAKIYTAEYSPIENYDRIEDSEDNRTHDSEENITGSLSKGENSTSSANSTITENKTSAHSGSDTTSDTRETSAYNATTYQADNQGSSILTHGETITDTGGGTNNTTGSANKTTTGTNSNKRTLEENEKNTHNSHVHGNIGVTTNTKMQTEEYEMIEKYNPYNFIAELFENQLTLFVY